MKRTVASRALGRGLAGVEPARPNTLIAFAAKGGSTAFDGDAKNSPFTSALLKHLARPGLELGKAFRLVRDDVMNATGNKQEPFVYGSLGGNDVALVPAPAAPPAASGGANAEIRRDYELAERVGTREGWDSFVAANPQGFYTDLAKAQRNKLAATERARGAAEEQARLAAEGARASEQAKAAAQSKAAEEARIAAEKKKQVEEVKLAVAEQARLKDEKAKEESAKSEKPAEQKVAALPPAQVDPDATLDAARSASASQDIPRLLQSELRRVGCKTGEIDSEWNASARKALSAYNDNARTRFDVKLASLDALDAVRAKGGRVCPLACDRGYRASGDQCVKEKRPVRAPKVVQQRERRVAPAGRGRCFSFNGKQVCE